MVQLLPHPPTKATPTFSNSSVSAKAAAMPPQALSPSALSRQSSPTRPASGSDASDKATAALIRRVLCPYIHVGSGEPTPIEYLLPPLTSNNDVDLQLYAIVAIVVKELVSSWYGKITPDQTFVEEIVRIVAHCTRTLEGRLRTVNLESLVFDEIPELVESHVLAYRISYPPIPSPLRTNPRTIYHSLNPHPALSPVPDHTEDLAGLEQCAHERAYRQLLVQGALAVLLPTEDLENPFLRTLVADAIGETILGNAIGGKACKSWFIWGNIVKIVEGIQARRGHDPLREGVETETPSRLVRFGLLAEKDQTAQFTEHALRSTHSQLFWRILQYGYFAVLVIRFMFLGIVAASSQYLQPSSSSNNTIQGIYTSPIVKIVESPAPRPILKFRIFSLISLLFNLPLRMPWLSGSLSLLQYHLIHGPWKVGATNGLFNQFIHHLIATHLHPPTLLPPLLASLRASLFPNFSLPPPAASPPPSPAEKKALKRACARALLSFFPAPVAARLFDSIPIVHDGEGEDHGKEAALRELEAELDVWSDSYMNRHLAYSVLELCLVRVLPEMGEVGVKELMEKRLGGAEE